MEFCVGASNAISNADKPSSNDPMTWVKNGKPEHKIFPQKDLVSSTFMDVDLKFAEGLHFYNEYFL